MRPYNAFERGLAGLEWIDQRTVVATGRELVQAMLHHDPRLSGTPMEPEYDAKDTRLLGSPHTKPQAQQSVSRMAIVMMNIHMPGRIKMVDCVKKSYDFGCHP
jgi:hypothetical protein